MKWNHVAGAVALVAATLAPVLAAEKSGPKAGAHITPFHVSAVTGEFKGRDLCYV